MDKVADFLKLLDDAGGRVRAIGQGAIGEELRQDPEARLITELIAGRITQAQSEVEQRSQFKTVVWVVLALALVLMTMMGYLAIAVPFIMIFGVVSIMVVKRATTDAAKRVSWFIYECRLAYGRCAGCGYGIRGLPPDDRGLVTCPECAARWDASRFKHTVSEHLRRELRTDENTRFSKWFWGNRPVLSDEEGRLHSAADPRLPGAEMWLDNAA